MPPKKVVKYIDLCCGIGGFRVALQQFETDTKNEYEFQCVFSADIKPDAIKIYNLNFNEAMKRTDIYTVDISDIPNFDLLCCGFPCQPFSSAGNKKGFNDARGGMIFKILEICKYHRPATFILENVSNLLTLEKGRCIEQIHHMFTDIGYKISYKKLNGLDFGVPQSRERVFITGSLEHEIDLSKLDYTQHGTLKDCLDYTAKYTDIDKLFAERLIHLHTHRKICGHKIQDKRGGDINIHSWDIDYNGELSQEEKNLMNKIMLERRKKHWATKKNIRWMDGMPLTESEIRTFYDRPNLRTMLDNLVKLGYLKFEKCKDLVDGKRQYKDDSENGYNICKGKLSFPVSRILDPNGVSPTLTATDCCKLVVIIDDKYIRKLTALELKRLCGYPDEFRTIDGVNVYDLFGNTLMPPIVRQILRLLYV